MPFEPSVSTGNWASMRDLAAENEVISIEKGFLRDDPNNTYQGNPAPRYVVKGTLVSTGEEIDVGVRQGFSRDTNLLEANDYLNTNTEGVTSLEFKFTETEGSQYIGIEFVGLEAAAE